MVTPGENTIPGFGRRFFGAQESFTRIGTGPLGGKAAGLDLIRQQVLAEIEPAEFPHLDVAIPTLTVLTTDLFDQFMERNQLYPIAISDRPDDRIAHAFQQADLPAEFVGDLRALISEVHTPLAIRSSSLLEDALDHPFAGVYGTKMIPNNQADVDTRFRRLVEAVKFVYASTFFEHAKSYMRSIDQDLRTEKMAIIIQEIFGERRGERFYPHISGVARSYNYYPAGPARPDEGVINLALGLGKQIVDGGLSWTYCPAHPKAPPPINNIADLLKNSQTEFWAVHMGTPPLPDPIRETEYLVRADLADAEMDSTLRFLVSTYDPQADRLRSGIPSPGPRVVNFDPILTNDVIPLNAALQRILDVSERVLGAAVELEFAVLLDREHGSPAKLGLLQTRPMMVSSAEIEIGADELVDDQVLIASEQVLGNGICEEIQDIVYLKPDVFEAKHTPQMVLELDGLNRNLQQDNRPYLLIGFGRWGSSDHWLGVPVQWGQISGARVIVEATLPDMNPDLSQGSHFFHNLISFHVLYLSVRHQGQYAIDWNWLDGQPIVSETPFVKHVRIARPLLIKVDGCRGKGVIRHAEET